MKMMRSLITALASLVILLTSVPSVLIAEEHVVYRPSQGSPATPFEWIYQTNVGRQQTREQDRPALQEALRIAFDNLPRDNALTRLLGLANNSGLCMGAGVDLWKDLTNVAITPGSSMFGWNVQVIENGCHVANLLSSPDNIKHYYIENNLSLRLIEMITLDGGGYMATTTG